MLIFTVAFRRMSKQKLKAMNDKETIYRGMIREKYKLMYGYVIEFMSGAKAFSRDIRFKNVGDSKIIRLTLSHEITTSGLPVIKDFEIV